MKGVIFNSVAEAVIEFGGEELWDDLLTKAGLTGAYTSLGSYDDTELLTLVKVTADALGKTIEETTEFVGELVFPYLSGRHHNLIANHTSTVSLLCELNDVIHPEVLKLYPDAAVPDFQTLLVDGNHLQLLYRSERQLPALAAGLIRGAANLYQEDVKIDIEPRDDGFLFDLVFTPSGEPTSDGEQTAGDAVAGSSSGP